MISLSETADGRTLLPLPPTLDNGVADALKGAFLAALATGKPVLVDAAAVERLSTTCIQVLIAGLDAIRAAGHEPAVAKPSETLVSAFDDLGLFPVMMKWRIEA